MADLTVRRTVAANPERVWRALTSAELAEWFWPSSWGTVADVELGDDARYHLWSDASGHGINGEYLELDPHRRLRQVWRWDDDGSETMVTITLEQEGDATALTIVHEGFPDDQARDDHLQGWNDCLDRLPGFLAR